MTPTERYARVTALFSDALERAPDERTTWLAEACDDPEIRHEVEAMLAHHADDMPGPLDAPVFARPASSFSDAADDEPSPLLGQRVGVWRVTGLLGRGGMGTVYRAERDDESFTQHAALKLVHPGFAPDFRLRFLRERALLAGLDHPGIARLLDGGLASDGAPYLAMEIVNGEPITAYAETHGLNLRERLGLFLQTCDAVAHAHFHLIVHRDLKPPHILVEDAEGGPRVKLLDFGIAKLLSEEDDGLTRTGSSGPLTPSYASPEQLLGQPITTATDVYALGIVLYEVLAGTRPYTVDGLSASQTERVICEAPPALPSVSAPAERARALRGDLDTIVSKALAKEPARRYPTAADFAADLRRYLGGLPVEARPATVRYRASRFLRRHRVASASVALVVAALITGTGVALWQAQAARAEAAKAIAMNGFLIGLLESADPTVEGREVRVVSLLDRAAADLDSVFAGQPDVEAAMRFTLGETYYQLGLYDEAEAQHVRALALRERLYGPRHPDVVRVQNELGFVWVQQDRLEPADSILTLALASARTFRDEDALLATVLSSLGGVRYWQGDQQGALDAHLESAVISERTDEPDEIEIAAAYGNVAVVLHELGRDDEALVYMERELEVYRRVYEPTNARIAMALRNLASGYHSLRRYDDAVRMNEEAIALFRQTVDPDSPDLANALSNHGPTLIKVGRYAEAEAAAREAMDIYARTVGTETQTYAAALLKASQAQELQGETAEAEAGIRRAIAIFRKTGPEDHPAMGYSQLALGKLLAAQERYAEAEPVLRRAFAIRSQSLAPDHPDRADIASRLGEVLGRVGQRAEAESLLVAGRDVLRQQENDERAPEAAARLAAFRAARTPGS
ncbi:MAG: serine/threonine-protein kinase [Rhodothermales bacterium]